MGWNTASFGVFLLVAVCAATGSARAFDDADCARLVPVDIGSVQEPYASAAGYAAAREKAQERAYEQAAAQVIGIWVESIRENNTQITQESARESFSEIDKSELSGFIRPTDAKESKTSIGGQEAVSLTMKALVCVPKPEVLARRKQEIAEQKRLAPNAVDPSTTAWFNAKNGTPLLWYRRDKNQQYFFFDNKGYDPNTGEALQPVNSRVREEWLAAEENRKRMVSAREEADKRAHDAAAAQDQLRAGAPENCDKLAGNPYDRGRGSSDGGATFDDLKLNVEDAIVACGAAVKQFPTELRFLYQLARAYQVNNPKKAIPYLRSLKQRRYAAAFDNYGWALLDQRTGYDDLSGALASFRQGASLGDPSSMYSLGSLILDGKTQSGDVNEALRWLRTAAQEGHLGAQSRLAEAEEAAQTQLRRANDEILARETFLRAVTGIIRSGIRN